MKHKQMYLNEEDTEIFYQLLRDILSITGGEKGVNNKSSI